MIRSRRDIQVPAGPPDPAAVETIVGKGTEIKGDIKGSGSLRVDGRVEGSIQTSGDLIVGESGVIVADVQAASVLVAGEVQGQVHATARLELAASGRIRGDVETPILVVNEGGRLDGKCAMTMPDRRAPVSVEHPNFAPQPRDEAAE
ncbi:MAG TPA: polymer-forming cytoskeletal protein [Limnochordales bacterium]